MKTVGLLEGGVLALALLGCGDDAGDDGAASGSGTMGTATMTATMTQGSGTSATPTTEASVDDTSATDDGPTGTEGGGERLEASCPGVALPPRPADTAARGPWAVGVRTVDLDGLTVEVWYPAEDPGEGAETARYDIRESLPASERDKVSDADNPWQECDCVRDLPIDSAFGPYPVVIFIHGTAGFRTQSLPHMVHWASRGFVVMAADHPGLWLADLVDLACGNGMTDRDLGGDLAKMLAAVRGEAPGLEDFGDRIDAGRIATAGHSAGGGAVSLTGDDAQVIIPMAAGGVEAGALVESSLVLGALSDTVVPFPSQSDGYDQTPGRKRLVGIANTGHLAFSEMCSLQNDTGANLIEIAEASGVCGLDLAGGLFQCEDDFIPDADAWDIVHFASSAVLEETLHCEPAAADGLALIKGRYPVVLEFREEL